MSLVLLLVFLHTWHTPSWCPLRRGYSCRWVSIHAGWFLRRHCAPHRKCGPAPQWCHCPWGGWRVGNNRNQLWVNGNTFWSSSVIFKNLIYQNSREQWPYLNTSELYIYVFFFLWIAVMNFIFMKKQHVTLNLHMVLNNVKEIISSQT